MEIVMTESRTGRRRMWIVGAEPVQGVHLQTTVSGTKIASQAFVRRTNAPLHLRVMTESRTGRRRMWIVGAEPVQGVH